MCVFLFDIWLCLCGTALRCCWNLREAFTLHSAQHQLRPFSAAFQTNSNCKWYFWLCCVARHGILQFNCLWHEKLPGYINEIVCVFTSQWLHLYSSYVQRWPPSLFLRAHRTRIVCLKIWCWSAVVVVVNMPKPTHTHAHNVHRHIATDIGNDREIKQKTYKDFYFTFIMCFDLSNCFFVAHDSVAFGAPPLHSRRKFSFSLQTFGCVYFYWQ